MATNNNNLLWRPLQTSYASCNSLQMRESVNWFEFGLQQHAPSSVLSSLYEGGGGDGDPNATLSMYDDMLVSKDFDDEELAEIDMESFRHEDMHLLLLNKGARRASSSLVTSSIYRPERLFSPVPTATTQQLLRLSQDSLDMSGYPTEDVLRTCKANKNNYTIAFEGSIICSEASFYAGASDFTEQRRRDLLQDLERPKAAPHLKMSTSDYNLTTWSKLKKTHNSSNLSRFQGAAAPPAPKKFQCWAEKRSSMGSSGNVMQAMGPPDVAYSPSSSHSSTWLLNTLRRTKSLSSLCAPPGNASELPVHIHHHHHHRPKLNVSQVIMDNMDQDSSTGSPSYEQNKLRSLLPNCAIPIVHQSQVDPQQQQHQQHDDSSSGTASTDPNTTTTSNNNNVGGGGGGGGGQQAPSFNLVKLFIKQKSSSTDTCMDVSSGCWPSESPSMSFEQQQQQQPPVNANIQNRNYFKKRLDRHEEENDVDSLDPLVNNNNEGGGGGAAVGSKGDQQQEQEQKQHTAMENNNNMINNLINNNHCLTDSAESITQIIYNNIRNNNNISNNAQAIPKKNTNLRRMQQMHETVTRSMQTSIPKLITSATQYVAKAADAAAVTSRGCGGGGGSALDQRVRIVPSSFLRQLHSNERRGEGGMAPVYVIYPNYTLPNLDFVAKHEVILSPIDYKEAFLGMGAGTGAGKLGAISKVQQRSKESVNCSPAGISPQSGGAGRPKSFTDILGGKQRTKFDYKNICDWRSLIVLLPVEYSRILRSIPDIEKELEGMLDGDVDDGFAEEQQFEQQQQHSNGDSMSSSRQLFCQTTPVMRRRPARPLSCDCAAYIMQNSSSSSSSNQPASSGYRGSSTILTDSEFGDAAAQAAAAVDEETAAGLPPTHCGRTPKGILRRNFNRTKMRVQQVKRNSMYTDGAGGGGEKVVDKRRSLQEFPTQQYFDNLPLAEAVGGVSPGLSPLLNYKQQGSGNDLSGGGLGRFRNKLSSELEALEMELYEAATRGHHQQQQQGELEMPEGDPLDTYDRLKLRNDVSRALCNHPKRVSFSGSGSDGDSTATLIQGTGGGGGVGGELKVPGMVDFTTPPNSPNVSVMAQKKRMAKQQQKQQLSEQERIQSNRFKRLQIQWELMSKDSESLLEELKEIIPARKETKSGGSTPTGVQRISRIPVPRPISYPAVGSRIPEPVKGARGKTAVPMGKKVQSPTGGGGSAVRGGKVAVASGQNNAKKTTANVTTNRFVPKAR